MVKEGFANNAAALRLRVFLLANVAIKAFSFIDKLNVLAFVRSNRSTDAELVARRHFEKTVQNSVNAKKVEVVTPIWLENVMLL
jgi:hypothetical protein